MFFLKVIYTFLFVVGVLFLKSLLKLSINRKRAEREYAETEIKPFDSPEEVTKLTILPLVDYYAAESTTYKTEAGVSYLITADDTNILMDLGENKEKSHPSPLLHNLELTGNSVELIDFIFLSHLHMDHVGGMKNQRNRTFSLSEDVVSLNDIPVYTPEPLHTSRLVTGATPEIIDKPAKIGKGIYSTGPIPRGLFYLGYTVESSIAFNLSGKGIVLVIGCGHPSIDKILERASALFDAPVYAIIGGLHLPAGQGRERFGPFDIQSVVGADRPPWNAVNRNDTELAIRAIKKVSPSIVALSPHDSSDWTIERFRESFGNKYRDIRVGEALEI